jgi:hypothetical protein
MMDVSTLEKGQFAPLFDYMMSQQMDQSSMGNESGAMAQSAAPVAGDMMGTGSMTEGMVTLSPGVVAGEDQFGTDLRAELESFLTDYFTNEMSMENPMDG